MSPKEAKIYAPDTFEPHWGGGKNDVILKRPEAIRTKGVDVMRHRHPFKNLVQCVSPLFVDCSGIFSPLFLFLFFPFLGPWALWETFKYSLATRMCWDRRTHDSRSLKDRMHILRSTSMISKFEVIMWTATLVYFRPHTMYRPIYETDMDKVMVCATCFGSFQFSLFPILFVLVLAMSMCHSWPHNTPIELVHSQSGPRESGWEGIVGHEHISHSSMLKKINMSFWEFLLHHLSYSMSRTIFVKDLN